MSRSVESEAAGEPAREPAGERWGARAGGYAASALFSSGEDLEVLARFAEPAPGDRVLDVGAAAGFAGLAVASAVEHVTVTDIAEGMLEAARGEYAKRGLSNADFRVAAAGDLPFAGASFDIVLCRIAAHHFPDPAAFVAEAARVLRPGGRFVLEDSIAPEDPAVAAFLDRFETVRDPTHGRYLPVSGWRALMERAGLEPTAEQVVPKRIDYAGWVERQQVPSAGRRELERLFAGPPPGAAEQLALERDGEGGPLAFTLGQALFQARREAA